MALGYRGAGGVAAGETSSQPQTVKDAKRETARCDFTRIRPRTLAHKAAIESGAAPLMAMDADRFDSEVEAMSRRVAQVGVASGVGGVAPTCGAARTKRKQTGIC